jgi:predicted ArsR family transcriptional regulator
MQVRKGGRMDNQKYNRPKRETQILILKAIDKLGGYAFARDIAVRVRLDTSTVRSHLREMLGVGLVDCDMAVNQNTGGLSQHFYSLVSEDPYEYSPPF